MTKNPICKTCNQEMRYQMIIIHLERGKSGYTEEIPVCMKCHCDRLDKALYKDATQYCISRSLVGEWKENRRKWKERLEENKK